MVNFYCFTVDLVQWKFLYLFLCVYHECKAVEILGTISAVCCHDFGLVLPIIAFATSVKMSTWKKKGEFIASDKT